MLHFNIYEGYYGGCNMHFYFYSLYRGVSFYVEPFQVAVLRPYI